jgi:hypothetical protein
MKRLAWLGVVGSMGLLAACNQPVPKSSAPAPTPAPATPQPAPAPAPAPSVGAGSTLTQEGLSACADVLRGQGFFIKKKEIDVPLYEFDAIKNNQEWKVKMSGNCEIVLQKLD